MKVLSLTQPWATLMAIGAKRYETRSWPTQHRGPLAIAASRGFPADCRGLATHTAPFVDVLAAAGIGVAELDAARGHILSVVDVVDVITTDSVEQGHFDLDETPPGEHELAFGNYAAGRYAWLTRNARRLVRPIAAKGRLGLWTYDDRAIAEALAS